MKILFLEDDPVIGEIVTEFLAESYEVTHAFNSAQALSLAESERFDLYIFDINVPGISGIELLKNLREFSDETPAIFITAYKELHYLKEAFSIGANDFIRKPFELEELASRVENIKRQFNIDSTIQISSEINFNPQTHQLIHNDTITSIAIKESAMLEYLIRNKQRVISSDEMLQNLWEYEEMPSEDVIRTYVKKLRHLIGKEHIINVRAQGYKFQ